MAIADDLHTLFKARREALEILDGQTTDADLHHIVEELEKLLYPIQFDKEGGKQNLTGLIMENSNYTDRFSPPFPRTNRPEIYNESIADSVASVICAKAEAIHRAHITDWDAFEAVEREAQSFIINAFDESWYSELRDTVTFYARVTTRKIMEHLQGICVDNHAIVILDLQDKMRVMHEEHDSIDQ